MLTIYGVSLPVSAWPKVSGIGFETLRKRIKAGWEPLCAVFLPPMGGGGVAHRINEQVAGVKL
jgi:hypothetical protein